MKLINFLRTLGWSGKPNHRNEPQTEINLHHHDLTDGCELLDETVHMQEQPFDENEEEGFTSVF